MLGWLKFFRLIWKLKLFDMTCVREKSGCRGKERDREGHLDLEEGLCGGVAVSIWSTIVIHGIEENSSPVYVSVETPEQHS